MATYQSSTFTPPAATASLVVNKPSGLVVGDLMVAFISSGNNNVPPNSLPTGFTLLAQSTDSNSSMYSYSKIATSGDVAASNFTFGFPGIDTVGGGLVRVNGFSPGNPIGAFVANKVAGSSTVTFTPGITPLNTNTLFLFGLVSSTQGNASGYAMVTNNPTWTEIIDTTAPGGMLAVAYANRTQSTATGNYSAVLGTPGSIALSVLLSINDNKDVTITETTTLNEAMNTSLEIFISDIITLSDSIVSTAGRVWSTVSKNISNWINPYK